MAYEDKTLAAIRNAHAIIEKVKIEGNGPWMFTHSGLECMIRRVESVLTLCGYVRVPETLRETLRRGPDIRDDFDVHYGVTWTGEFSSRLGIDGYWIGFDCGHLGDVVPGLIFRDGQLNTPLLPNLANETYRDLNFVTEQTKSLAEQIMYRIEKELL